MKDMMNKSIINLLLLLALAGTSGVPCKDGADHSR